MTLFLSGTVRKAPGGSPFIVFFCQVAIVAALPPGQVLHHAVPALIGSLNVGGGPAPGKIVVGADLDFLDLRVALQKSVQRKGVLGLPFLPLSFFRCVDAAEGQPPFVCGPLPSSDGPWVQWRLRRQPPGWFFPFGGQKEGKPLIAARHLCLEGFSPCVGAAQEGVPGSAGFIPADENSVVVVCAFIEDPCPDGRLR